MLERKIEELTAAVQELTATLKAGADEKAPAPKAEKPKPKPEKKAPPAKEEKPEPELPEDDADDDLTGGDAPEPMSRDRVTALIQRAVTDGHRALVVQTLTDQGAKKLSEIADADLGEFHKALTEALENA